MLINKGNYMNEEKAKQVIDAFEKAEKITQSRTPLPSGVIPSHIKLIDWIYQLSQKGNVKVSDLAEALHLSRPGITRSLNKMEEIGLIEKNTNQEDRRVVYVSLTKKGEEIYYFYVDKYFKKLADRLSVYKDEDIQKMIEMVDLIYEDLMEKRIVMEEDENE